MWSDPIAALEESLYRLRAIQIGLCSLLDVQPGSEQSRALMIGYAQESIDLLEQHLADYRADLHAAEEHHAPH